MTTAPPQGGSGLRRARTGLPFRAWIALAFGVLFAVSAIKPWHPRDFIVEHILTVIALVVLYVADRRRPLSNAATLCLFAFFVLHLIGAHYTYSEVPYDAWTERLFGVSLTEATGATRNHYDRLVHTCFGLLLVYPMRELLAHLFPELRRRDLRLLLGAVLMLAVMSKVYELIEWGVAVVMTEEDASIYNGEQGDLRDAHKDMALALLGAIISAVLIFACETRPRRAEPLPMR